MQLSTPYFARISVLTGGSTGVLLGLAALVFSPLWVLIALLSVGIALAIFQRPEIGILGILMIHSTIVPEASLPRITIGIGTLYIPDILLFGLMISIVIRVLAAPNLKIVRTPLDCPLLAFVAISMLSTLIAILQSSVTFNESLAEIRLISSYMTFFLVTNLVREDHQIRTLWRGTFLLAMIVVAAMITQLLLGVSQHLLPGRVEVMSTQDVEFSGTLRILPPGQSLVLVAFISGSAILVLDKFRTISILRFLQWGLVGLALILTFNRSYWVAATLALVLIAHKVRGHARQRLIWLSVSVISLLLIVIILLPVIGALGSRPANLVKATIARMSTLGNSKTVEESSLRWRYVENNYARSQIASTPLLGLGLGGKYRPFDRRIDYAGIGYDGRRYIHNGHLWVIVKTGLLGYPGLGLVILYVSRSRVCILAGNPQLPDGGNSVGIHSRLFGSSDSFGYKSYVGRGILDPGYWFNDGL